MLARLAQILGEQGISIASVIQHDPGDDAPEKSPVPLVIMTHLAVQADLHAALERDRSASRSCTRPASAWASKTEIARFARSPYYAHSSR